MNRPLPFSFQAAFKALSLSILLTVGSSVAAGPNLAEVAGEYKALQKKLTQIYPDIDGQRLVPEETWAKTIEKNASPWLVYGEDAYSDWQSAALFVLNNADELPLGLELYDRIERLALKNHYYAGFEIRRIKDAVLKGTLSEKKAKDLLDRIEKGEKIYFSGVDHRTLPGTFRSDPLDEIDYDGEASRKNGPHFLRNDEVDMARENPLLRVVESSLVEAPMYRMKGTIEYPRTRDLKKLVRAAFDKMNESLQEKRTLEDRIKDIIAFGQELATIHRSHEGDDRVVNLLTDLLFMRAGLPPPAYVSDFGPFVDPKSTFNSTVEGMQAYVKSLRNRLVEVKPPPVLFHWTNDESFRWMLEHRSGPEQVPMKIFPANIITSQFPGLANAMGTFTWINPLMAMAGGKSSYTGIGWYVGVEDPVLLAYFIDPKARVKTLRTVYGGKAEKSAESFQDVDLIYHQALDTKGQLKYHEWIILNPAVVKNWTADPKVLEKYIEPERQRLERLGDRYPELDRHFLVAGRMTSYIDNLSKLIIGNYLQRKPQIDEISCSDELLGKSRKVR